MKEVSVILPTYNEKDNVTPLILEIQKHLKGRDYEIIVVDDDSPDGTWKLVESIKKKDGPVKLIRRQGRTGLTSAISEGIDSSSGSVIVWMDADLSMPPEKIKSLLEKIDDGYDIAVASRYVAGGGMVIIESSEDSFFSAILSFAMNFAIQKLLDPSFKDYTSGFIAVKKNVLEDIILRGDYGEYFIDFIYKAIKKKYKIIEIPYVSGARRFGKSKTGSNLFEYFSRGKKYIWTAVRVKFTRIK